MHRLRLLAILLVTGAAVLISNPAHADQWGTVHCDLTPNDPSCTVTVVDPGGSTSDGSGGATVCHLAGKVVPCHSDAFGWLGADNCYYGKDGGGFIPVNDYIKTCYDPATGAMVVVGLVTLVTPPATLDVVAQRAVSRLAMPQPVIASNPALDKPQVVHVPVWWWIEPELWQTRTATASIPGITITARAVPTKITWYAGDGTVATCTGPGTPWAAQNDPAASSPTCGHTYTTTSRTSPGGKFTLRAVVTWNIDWAGGGGTGTEPAMTTTSTIAINVTELRAVITQ